MAITNDAINSAPNAAATTMIAAAAAAEVAEPAHRDVPAGGGKPARVLPVEVEVMAAAVEAVVMAEDAGVMMEVAEADIDGIGIRPLDDITTRCRHRPNGCGEATIGKAEDHGQNMLLDGVEMFSVSFRAIFWSVMAKILIENFRRVPLFAPFPELSDLNRPRTDPLNPNLEMVSYF